MKRNRPCQAANPATCQYHKGKLVGIKADQHIQTVLTVEPKKYHLSREELRTKPLKELSATALALAIRNHAQETDGLNTEKTVQVIKLASDLHKEDTRSNRGRYNITPYIEHPLRNTLRLIRYGCKNQEVIAGSILHDTVEDHPFEMSEKYYGKKAETEEEARANCYKYIEKEFGSKCAAMVKGMSNPILPKYMPAVEKNQRYADHVAEEIHNPHVFVGKICDLVDNAVGLHHNLQGGGLSPLSVKKKATKYLKVWDVIENQFELVKNKGTLPVSSQGIRAIENHIRSGRKSLEKLSKIAA